MRLFSNLPEPDSPSAFEAVTQVVEEKANVEKAKQFGEPWSLVELRADEDDVNWLKALFENLPTETIRPSKYSPLSLKGKLQEAQLGCLLMLLECELARRHASEGTLWAPVLRGVEWSEDARRFLFIQGQPTPRHRAALEAAVREFNLRQAFGEDSAQEWYQSVYLQFGFTRRGFEHRLPEWLVGQGRPIAVERLLSDARYSSDSFFTLWDALRAYRKGNLEREQVRRALVNSPWILPEWVDGLISQCRARIEVLGFEERPESEVGRHRRRNTASHCFLATPRLTWSGGTQPHFVTEVALSDDLALEEDSYDVRIGIIPRARILRQSDGQYVPVSSDVIRLPADSPELEARLTPHSGETGETQELALWSLAEDVEVFDATSGKRIDAWGNSLDTQRDHLLVVAHDLCVEPSDLSESSFGNGIRRVVCVPAQQLSVVRVFLGDDLLWEPWCGESEPTWMKQVTLEVKQRACGASTQATLRIRHPNNVVVVLVRYAGRLLEFGLAADVTETEPVSLDSHSWDSSTLTVWVVLRHGHDRCGKQFRPELRPLGHLRHTGKNWQLIGTNSAMDLSDARASRMLFAPKRSIGCEFEWHVFEGNRWICPVDDQARRLLDLQGWGAPLALRIGPYNSTEPDEIVAREIHDWGILRDVAFLDSENCELTLQCRLEPDDSHSIVCLDQHGRLHPLARASITAVTLNGDTTVWSVSLADLPVGRSEPIALGIAYEGQRLGCWWATDWVKVFDDDNYLTSDDAGAYVEETAQAVRWLHLPLLNRDVMATVKDFAKTYPLPVLKAWLAIEGPPELDYFRDAGDGWDSVVRHVFADWIPKDEEAQGLDREIERLFGGTGNLPLLTTVESLTRLNPILAARVVRAWLRSKSSEVGWWRETRSLLAGLQQGLLKGRTEEALVIRIAQDVGRMPYPTDGTCDFVHDSLLQTALGLFNQDPNTSVTDAERRNFEVALRLEPFRTLVIVRCLNCLREECARWLNSTLSALCAK